MGTIRKIAYFGGVGMGVHRLSSNRDNKSLNYKLTIFYNIYNRVSLLANLYIKAFLAILKGIA